MNLQELINSELKIFDEMMGVPPEVYELWKDKTCPICGQPCDKSKQYQDLKQFLQDFGNRIARETAKAIKVKGVADIGAEEYGWNSAIEEQNKNISLFLG